MNCRPRNVGLWLWMILFGVVSVGSFTVPAAPAWADDHDEREVEEDEHEDHDGDEDDWEDIEEEMSWFLMEVEMYQQLLEVVLSVHEIADKSSVAGVAAVLAVEEHFEGPAESAAFLEGLLPKVADPTVARAIRLQLVDFYAESDQPEKSRAQLEMLILGSK